MIRVYTLNGLIPIPGTITLMPSNHCGGQLFTNPYTRRDIRYQNWAPLLAFAQDAADKVLAEAQKPGQKIFIGHSMGAEALCLLLRSDPDVDPDENVFVMTGNPERKYGGKVTLGAGSPAYGGIGFPDDTPFRVWDVARQYDHFADYPTSNVKAALTNINDIDSKQIHLDYSSVRIGDPGNVKIVEGNVTYELVPTFPCPTAKRLWWGPDREALEDRKIRPQIEAGYTRPFGTLPTPTLKRFGKAGGYDTASRQPVTAPVGNLVWNPFA